MDMKEDFINYLRFEKRYSPLTIVSYSNDLTQFFLFLGINGNSDEMVNIDSKLIRSWIVSLMDHGISSRSVNRKISTLRSFFKFLIKENIVKVNPLVYVLKPKIKKRLPVFVEKDSLDSLLDNHKFGDDFEGKRNKLIIETFYLTGMRLSELINLRDTDIDKSAMTVKVLGKRNKERLIPLIGSFLKEVDAYIAERNKLFGKSTVPFLFITDQGKKTYPKLIYRIVKKYLEMVTTIERKSPHILRHTFATQLLNNGADLNAIKELLGHSNLSATQVYTHNTFEKLKLIYQQAHPRA
jgi:integrase/recombinase XerC